MNSREEEDGLELGETLSALKSFAAAFPPDLKGEAIGASQEIRVAHNSFARNHSVLAEQRRRPADEEEDVFHFVAYVPHGEGVVYELDGLKEGPVQVGTYTHKEGDVSPWLDVARRAIQARIDRYSASEIKFNLMAVVQDRRIQLRRRLHKLQQENLQEDHPHVLQVTEQLLHEQDKRNTWHLENQRRRHNYLPLALELLKAMVRNHKLSAVTQKASQKIAHKKSHQTKMPFKNYH